MKYQNNQYTGGSANDHINVRHEELIYKDPSGGTASVNYVPDYKKIDNIVANINPGYVEEFKNWVAERTKLDFDVVNNAWNRYIENVQKLIGLEQNNDQLNHNLNTKKDNIIYIANDLPLDKQQEYIDKACIEWASRDSFGYFSMEGFLERKFGIRYGQLVMPVPTFKKHLHKAWKRGLIGKGENGRFCKI